MVRSKESRVKATFPIFYKRCRGCNREVKLEKMYKVKWSASYINDDRRWGCARCYKSKIELHDDYY